MEVTFEEGQGPEGVVAPYMDGWMNGSYSSMNYYKHIGGLGNFNGCSAGMTICLNRIYNFFLNN
jgi:hypothetical protein